MLEKLKPQVKKKLLHRIIVIQIIEPVLRHIMENLKSKNKFNKRYLLLVVVFIIIVILSALLGTKKNVLKEASDYLIYVESKNVEEFLYNDSYNNVRIIDLKNASRKTIEIPSSGNCLSFNSASKKLYYLGLKNIDDKGELIPIEYDLNLSTLSSINDTFNLSNIYSYGKIMDFRVHSHNENLFAFCNYDKKNNSIFNITIFDFENNVEVINFKVSYKYAPKLVFFEKELFVLCEDYIGNSRIEKIYHCRLNDLLVDSLVLDKVNRHLECSNLDTTIYLVSDNGKVISAIMKDNDLYLKELKSINVPVNISEKYILTVVGVLDFNKNSYLLKGVRKNNLMQESFFTYNIYDNKLIKLSNNDNKKGGLIIISVE